MQRFIVGEVTCNWQNGTLVEPSLGLMCQRFENLIAVNLDRGYVLHSFNLHQLAEGYSRMHETIVAVFELVGTPMGER